MTIKEEYRVKYKIDTLLMKEWFTNVLHSLTNVELRYKKGQLPVVSNRYLESIYVFT